MSWTNIPRELQDLPQWCCAGQDRAPIDPRTGRMASVDDPDTWVTFEEASQAGYPFIGFMLWQTDPYCVIDLDNKVTNPATAEELERYVAMMESFDSYTEESCSGRGLHIVVKAELTQGRRRDKVEVYSSHRFMIFTGKVVRQAPIAERQDLVDNMVSQMEAVASATDLTEIDETLADRDLVETAMYAANGAKFNQLCRGEWQQDYESQSEADFALMTILAYYTRSNEQVRRLFRMSALGQRDKAWRDSYLNYALSKIRAKQPPPVDLSNLRTLPEPEVSTGSAEPVDKPSTPLQGSIAPPPGLIGELATYIYQSSSRPVWEISLCAAIALTAGISGRHYNISGTGLNQYIILLAKTGTGKEEAAKGIDRLLTATRTTTPPIDEFLGPGAYASGQAIVRALDDQPCMVSVLGEFGMLLQTINDPRASSASVTLRRALLDLYSKSGWGQMLRSSAYSDKEKNTKTVVSPSLTLLGESTPEEFYGGLSESQIASGLIPRFLVVEYKGQRPHRNKQGAQPPDPMLVQRLADLTTTVLHMRNNSTHAQVQLDPQAAKLLDDFDRHCDDQINNSANGAEAQLWNRAHLKALKLAALVAVGCDMHAPTVTTNSAQWAIDLVQQDVHSLLERFAAGEVGQGEHNQESDVRRVVKDYLAMTAEQRASYKVPKALQDKPAVPFTYLRRRLRVLSTFKNDRKGLALAIKLAVQDAVEGGILKEVPQQDVRAQWGLTATVYVLGDQW